MPLVILTDPQGAPSIFRFYHPVESLLRLITLSDVDPRQEGDFDRYKRKLFISIAEGLYWIFAVLISISWILQFFIYDRMAAIRRASLMRGSVLLIIVLFLVSVRYSTTVRRHALPLCCLGIALSFAIVGYFTGKMKALSNFYAFAYFAPIVALLLPVNLGMRSIITIMFPTTFSLTLLITSDSILYQPTFPQQAIALAIFTCLSIVIGHMFFYLIRRNYFTQRELYEKREKLEYLASHDRLTDLLNRRALEEKLQDEIEGAHRRGREFSLLLLDLDHFKEINDTHGHLAGDSVLEKLGELIDDFLTDQSRPDGFAGRYGGEEFAVVLPDTALNDARQVAQNLRSALSSMTFTDSSNQTFGVTCSIGVTVLTEEDNFESLLQRADQALYDAKQTRNSVETIT